MAALVVCALCALVILKPQEFISALEGLPLIYVVFGVAVVGLGVDVVRRKLRPALAPHVPLFLAFFAWALLTTAVKRPDALDRQLLFFAILTGLFLAVWLGTSSAFGQRAFGVTFLGCALLVTGVAVVQSQGDYGCFLAGDDDWEGKGELASDGRPCETALDCRKDAPFPDGNYRCERAGPLGTSTIGGRVRYRGSLADPNELSLMLAMAAPFAFAFGALRGRAGPRRSHPGPAAPSAQRVPLPPLMSDGLLRGLFATIKALPAAAVLGLMGVALVFTQSRSGLLVFLLVVGLQVVRQVGLWGVVAGCLFAPPMILLGGRSGLEADSSTDERAELLREALEFIRSTKGIGLGAGQFPDNSSIGLTAHNAYVLAAAEAGLVGMCLFGLGVYATLKVPLAIWFGAPRVDAITARLAPAVAVGLCGAVVGMLFLSWTYKDVFYLLAACSAGMYGAARAADPAFRVRLSLREVAAVVVGLHVLLFAVYVGGRLYR